MYILTQNNKFLAVPVNSRTCIIGFKEYENAKSARRNIVKGFTNVYFDRQRMISRFITDSDDTIEVSKVSITDKFHKYVTMNNFMIFMTEDFRPGIRTLYLDGIIMTHEFEMTDRMSIATNGNDYYL